MARKGDRRGVRDGSFSGKTVYIPALAGGSARAFAAAFRAVGLKAEVTPPSDNRTLELGAQYTWGDECFPGRLVVGDFLKVLKRPGIDPDQVVLFLSSADGPCRVGQYARHLRVILDRNGFNRTSILSPSTDDPYQTLDALAGPFLRTAWRAIVSADILRKLLLRYRPYEATAGNAWEVYEECVGELCRTIERTPTRAAGQMRMMRTTLVRCRDRFRAIGIHQQPPRPVIGIIGEMYCRLNRFANQNFVERLEDYGAEVWMSDFTEWIWYMHAEQFRLLKLEGRWFSAEALAEWIRCRIQYRDEHQLLEPFREDFRDREEPGIATVLRYARPYLPQTGAMGEMVMSIGKAVHFARSCIDGIIDISPFTCMNGIVCEAIYPRLSRDLNGIPIRSFYFDGNQSDLDMDLGVFMELVQTYRRDRGGRRLPLSA